MTRNPIVGCIVTPILTLAFYGAIAIVVLALIAYPVIYLQDVSSADAYRTAALCEPGHESSSCRAHAAADVSNTRSFDGQPEFDVQMNGKLVSVTRDSGAYQPRNGDTVQLEVWRDMPVRVTSPEGSVMITDQYPDARLRTDHDVLGIFTFAGVFSLAVAVLVGWFGRRIVFARFQGMSPPSVLKGFLVAFALILVALPVTLVGQSSGWLPQGRVGALVVGLAGAVIFVPAALIYRRLRARQP